MTLKQVLEALVFASPKPLLTREIMAALRSAADSSEDDVVRDYGKAPEETVLQLLAEVKAEYEASQRAFRLVEQVNGWSLVTEASAAPWVRQLYPEAKPTRLSGPALETLAIIAYRQPVTRADIEAVRGVAVDGVMQVLLDRSLVKIAGRAEVPGRPLLYSTTEYFLQHFGLKTVDELPNASELRRIPLPQAPPPEEKKPKEKTANPEPSNGVEVPAASAPDAPVEAASESATPETAEPALQTPLESEAGTASLDETSPSTSDEPQS